jgi:hypothetical protein
MEYRRIATPPPTEEMVSKKWYHGTSKESNAKKIMEEGLQPPDLTDRHGWLKPVEGRVYLTEDLSYALIYAVGANMVGTELPNSILEDDGQYGYLFVVEGSQLADIQPDEDSVGEKLYELLKNLEKEKRGITISPNTDKDKYWWLIYKAKQYLSASFLRKFLDGDMIYQARAGKTLMKYLSDKQKLQLISDGAHIANQGGLIPAEVWKIDKERCSEFQKDGSNCFEIAERIR